MFIFSQAYLHVSKTYLIIIINVDVHVNLSSVRTKFKSW